MTKRQVGDVVKAKVVKILDSGAIVSFGDNENGFLHISEISKDFVKKVDDVLKQYQKLDVEIIKIDGIKMFVSMKSIEDKTKKTKEFEEKIQDFLKTSSEKQRQIQKSNDKKRGYYKKNPSN
jgi:S1 RNA binding domain protein